MPNVPDTNEFDRDFHRKGFFEFGGLLPSDRVCACIHLVGKWNLLEIVSWKEANFMKHSSKTRSSLVNSHA